MIPLYASRKRTNSVWKTIAATNSNKKKLAEMSTEITKAQLLALRLDSLK